MVEAKPRRLIIEFTADNIQLRTEGSVSSWEIDRAAIILMAAALEGERRAQTGYMKNVSPAVGG